MHSGAVEQQGVGAPECRLVQVGAPECRLVQVGAPECRLVHQRVQAVKLQSDRHQLALSHFTATPQPTLTL